MIHGTLTVVFDVSYLSFLPGLVSRERLSEANGEAPRDGGDRAGDRPDARRRAHRRGRRRGRGDRERGELRRLGRVRARTSADARRSRSTTQTRRRDELLEGVRYVFAQPYLRTLTIWTSLWNLFTSGFFAIEIVYFVRVLHWGATEIGIVLALGELGAPPRRLRERAARRALRDRADDRVLRDRVLRARSRPSRARRARTPPSSSSVTGFVGVDRRVLREREPADVPPGDHADAAARTDELGRAAHVLGDDPGRVGARRGPRRPARPAHDALRRRRSARPCRASRSRPPGSGRCGALPCPRMPEYPEMEAWRRQLADPVSAFPIAKAGPAHIATLKTFDPPLVRPRRTALRRRRAARQAPPLPHRGRRARAPRPPDDVGAAEVAARRRQGAEGAGVRPRVRRRLEARPHREREAQARGRVAPHAGRRRERARAPRPGGGGHRRRRAGDDPPRRRAAPARAAARPARDRRHRPRVGERDPPRGEALAVRALEGSRRRGDRAARRRDRLRARPRPRAPRARRRRRARRTASTTSSGSPATCAARRSPGSTSRSTRSTTAPSARPAGASSRTGGCRGSCVR